MKLTSIGVLGWFPGLFAGLSVARSISLLLSWVQDIPLLWYLSPVRCALQKHSKAQEEMQSYR